MEGRGKAFRNRFRDGFGIYDLGFTIYERGDRGWVYHGIKFLDWDWRPEGGGVGRANVVGAGAERWLRRRTPRPNGGPGGRWGAGDLRFHISTLIGGQNVSPTGHAMSIGGGGGGSKCRKTLETQGEKWGRSGGKTPEKKIFPSYKGARTNLRKFMSNSQGDTSQIQFDLP